MAQEINAPSPAMDDPYYDTRQAVVAQINQDRAANGVGPVEFDALSSRVGDQHCQEMAANRYLSHWNLRGLLPYHRYHFAGGQDHVQENSSRMTVFSSAPAPIPTEPDRILPHLLEAHERLVNEKPPLDGHRKNILDPAHTHVGIGLGVVGGELMMTQQFINRYVRLKELPEVLPRRSIQVEGEVLHKDFGPYFCILFCEGLLRPRTVEELNRTYAYTDMHGDECGKTSPWEMSFDRGRRRFRFSMPVRSRGPGYYHLLLWVRRPINVIPYQVYPGGAYKIDTKFGIPCAGWVFRQQ